MIKKILFLGISFVFALAGLFSLVVVENPTDENTKVALPDRDDDDLEEKPDTGDGVMFLSIGSFNLR